MLSRTRRKANESDASEEVLRNLTTLDRDGEGGRPTGCWLHMISPARDVKRSAHTEGHGSCRKTDEAMAVPDGPPHQGRARKDLYLCQKRKVRSPAPPAPPTPAWSKSARGDWFYRYSVP